MMRHGIRNSLLPVVALVSVWLGGLLGGSVVVEVIFGIPGMGRLLYDAVVNGDIPVIQVGVVRGIEDRPRHLVQHRCRRSSRHGRRIWFGKDPDRNVADPAAHPRGRDSLSDIFVVSIPSTTTFPT